MCPSLSFFQPVEWLFCPATARSVCEGRVKGGLGLPAPCLLPQALFVSTEIVCLARLIRNHFLVVLWGEIRQRPCVCTAFKEKKKRRTPGVLEVLLCYTDLYIVSFCYFVRVSVCIVISTTISLVCLHARVECGWGREESD